MREELLYHGANVNQSTDNDGSSPLYIESFQGHFKCVREVWIDFTIWILLHPFDKYLNPTSVIWLQERAFNFFKFFHPLDKYFNPTSVILLKH